MGRPEADSTLERADALFPRVEYKKEEVQEKAAISFRPEITYDDFKKIDIRVARIVAAKLCRARKNW